MRRLSGDAGIAAVFVGVSLIAILGMFALVLDMGRIYQERRELQSGADAAVLAVAEDCGLGVIPCDDPTAASTSQVYANLNATDQRAGIYEIDLDLSAQTIEVVASTVEASNGGTILQPLAAQIIGFSGFEVGARAKAAWGAPKSAKVLPLIISDCEYDDENDIVPRPPEGEPWPGDSEVTIFFHAANETDPCNAQPGFDIDGDGLLPGGFGWLLTLSGCTLDAEVGVWVSADPGASPSTGCSASFFRDNFYQNYVKIPYFDDADGIQGVGASGEYHIAGFGVLYVTGYNFGGQFKEPAGSPPCGGALRCISGYFTTGTDSEGEIDPDAEIRGLLIVKLIL